MGSPSSTCCDLRRSSLAGVALQVSLARGTFLSWVLFACAPPSVLHPHPAPGPGLPASLRLQMRLALETSVSRCPAGLSVVPRPCRPGVLPPSAASPDAARGSIATRRRPWGSTRFTEAPLDSEQVSLSGETRVPDSRAARPFWPLPFEGSPSSTAVRSRERRCLLAVSAHRPLSGAYRPVPQDSWDPKTPGAVPRGDHP